MNQNGLKKVLLANALFSGLSGLLMLTAAGSFAAVFAPASPWLFRGIGLGLVLFAADLAVESRRREIKRSKALYFSAGDFAWVVGSVVVLVAAPLSQAAALLVACVMLAVLAFAVTQWRCIRPGATG